MRKSRLLWAAVLVSLLLVNLVISAPARLLGTLLPGEQLVMHGLTGTVWHGSARSMLLRLPQGYLQLGAVSWSLRPLSLLLLAPHVVLSTAWGDQILVGELVLRGQRDLDVFNLEAQLPADLLGRFAPVAVNGLFKLQMQSLQLREGLPHSAAGRLVWQDASWQSPQGLVPLGSYALDVQQAEGEALGGQVLTLSGPLQANGTVQLQERHYAADILLVSEGGMDPKLQQMLSLIAVAEDAGYRVSVKGDF